MVVVGVFLVAKRNSGSRFIYIVSGRFKLGKARHGAALSKSKLRKKAYSNLEICLRGRNLGVVSGRVSCLSWEVVLEGMKWFG